MSRIALALDEARVTCVATLMKSQLSLHDHWRLNLLVFAGTALVVCEFCHGEPMSKTGGPATTHKKQALAPSDASQLSSVKSRYPDPRYRPPVNFAELEAVAGGVAKTSGRKIHWRLVPGKDPCPLIMIHGGLEDCTITIHPVAARTVPPNTWAFLMGHEFAHLVENLGAHSKAGPASELKADIAGARYAMAAGYRIDAFLGWALTERDQSTSSHGNLHDRVQAMATNFGVRQSLIQAEAQRYSKPR